jgi:hypothetical protein
VVARTQILEDSRDADAESEGGALFGLSTKAVPSSALLDVDVSRPDERSAGDEPSFEDLLQTGARRRMAAAAIALLVFGGVFAARLRASHRRAFVARAAPVVPRIAPAPVPVLSRVMPLPSRRSAPLAAPDVSGAPSEVPAPPPVVRPARRHHVRHPDRAALERPLPNIDQAGIGIPSE